LLLLILVIFKHKAHIQPLITNKTAENRVVIIATILSFGVGIYTYNFLPVMDFLPYKVGANILDEMKTPPGAMPDEFEITYHMRNSKSGATKDVTDKEYTKSNIWKDTTWKIVGDPENRLVKKGFTPKIQDLKINDAQGNDYTKELLSNPFYNLVIVAYDLDNTSVAAVERLNALAITLSENYNTRTIFLTSNAPRDAEVFGKTHKLLPEIFYADGVPLKSMVRSNPGVLLMKNGVIIAKWHYHTVPSYDKLVKLYFQQP